MANWVCMKCGHKWIIEGKIEPRQCPICGSCTIYVPKVIKKN
jgi:rubrerythrin